MNKWYLKNRERLNAKRGEQDRLARSSPDSWIKVAVKHAKARAGRNSIPFDLTADDIEVTTVCPVFGTIIEYGGGLHNPVGPSLDRLIPQLGYVKGNVRVISFRANTLKQDASIDEVRQILKYMENTP